MQFVIALAFAALLIWYAWTFTTGFAAASGPLWDRLLAAGRGSATKLWAKFVAVVGAAVGVLASSADFFGSPAVADAIRAYVTPEYVAAAFLVVSLITELARNRTLGT